MLLLAWALAAAPLIDLDYQEADIHVVLRHLAEAGEFNLVVDDRVQGKVTVRLRRVTYDEALAAVLAAKGLVAVPTGPSTWKIGPP